MGDFLISRLLSALVVILGTVCLVFMLIHLVPGDPVDVMLGESARPSDREALRVSLGLDQSIAIQLSHYLKGIAVLDLGTSLHTKQPVTELLASRIPATLQLAFAALFCALSIAIPLGILAAVNRGGSWDWGAMGFSMLGVSIPNFWLGPMLILCFSLWLGWTPVSGREGLSSLILPAVTLGSSFAAILARMVRSSLLEVMGEDFVRTARAKGLDESRVIWHHAMRNAWLPVITLLGL
ncbi:MAG: ABC transporter permease, partial [Candidatus Thiodiazotropha sp. (ex Lucinoma annulata)]|nr:ABC transporter permease [Candidatus Thiodiazotropha sp. (ex Lucinoma annulata)]